MNAAATQGAVALELCLDTDDLSRLGDNVRLAAELGVARLELCAAMQEDGLTPTPAAVALARQLWGERPGVMAMLRPRGGDFVYHDAELARMQQQMVALAAAGADAVVLGALDGAGQWHWPALQQLTALAQSLGLTVAVHRAIDACADPLQAWRQLQQLPVARVLSSGTRWGSGGGAVEGLPVLQQLRALGGPELVVGGGVSAANLPLLRQQLSCAAAPAPFSFHLYSAVLQDGRVEPKRLAAVLQLLTKD